MKGVGNKRQNTLKIIFLKYLTYELGMISGLFSRRPFIKILFSHLTILISRFRIIIYFSEISAKFPVKFFENFPENYHIPTPHITHPHPIPQTVNSLRTLDPFSQKHIFSVFWCLFPTPFIQVCMCIHTTYDTHTNICIRFPMGCFTLCVFCRIYRSCSQTLICYIYV